MANDDALAILRGARALLDSPERWAQGTFAATEDGRPCVATSVRAASWCLAGALDRAGHGWADRWTFAGALRALRDAARLPIGESLMRWNDEPGRKYADILTTVDAAIAALEARHAD